MRSASRTAVSPAPAAQVTVMAPIFSGDIRTDTPEVAECDAVNNRVVTCAVVYRLELIRPTFHPMSKIITATTTARRIGPAATFESLTVAGLVVLLTAGLSLLTCLFWVLRFSWIRYREPTQGILLALRSSTGAR